MSYGQMHINLYFKLVFRNQDCLLSYSYLYEVECKMYINLVSRHDTFRAWRVIILLKRGKCYGPAKVNSSTASL